VLFGDGDAKLRRRGWQGGQQLCSYVEVPLPAVMVTAASCVNS